MEEHHKHGLPKDRTYTLKEYAELEENINIPDPYGKSLEEYRKCRNEIKRCLEQVIERIIRD
jgi:protein-tyrosine phosphatase